ncbi:MAG: UDP-N-acetylglucosamine 2-epimerase [Brockia lithotrophica]|nr:UDP-N-acetylglucosamine 2-epimerase [Brockia lithotrophica]
MADLSQVLVLSASFGEGHRQASQAIREEILAHYPDAQVDILDYIQTINRAWSRVAQFFYIQGIKRTPGVYGFFYHHFNKIPMDSALSRGVSRLGLIVGGNKLLTYLERKRPRVVVHTFPTSAGAHGTLKEDGLDATPSVTLITDYAPHRQWLHRATDMYFVAAPKVREELVREGVPREKIRVTGIPVRQRFRQSYDSLAIRAKLGLAPNVPTLLVLGGAFGVSLQIVALAEYLAHFPDPVQLIFVTGRNHRLFEQLERALRGTEHPTLLFGFVEEIAEIMAAADFIVTKSGGLTTTEAVAMERPLLLLKPIPGQEKANADFFVEKGVAHVAETLEELKALSGMFLKYPQVLEEMRRRIVLLKRELAEVPLIEALREAADLGEVRRTTTKVRRRTPRA